MVRVVKRIRTGVRYFTNLAEMVALHEGYPAAAAFTARFVGREAAQLPRYAQLLLKQRKGTFEVSAHPAMYSQEIVQSISNLGYDMREYEVDVPAFWAHVRQAGYPERYAAGPSSQGGRREQKLLEYFVSLDLLDLRRSDVLIDVASEWSMYPEVIRELTGATVYRQDLIFKAGLVGDRIGGSATTMPVHDGFADKLVLHNAFEHFEGSADTDFIHEAWRVLRPNGKLLILPLFMSDTYSQLTDPLVNRKGIVWDEGAQIIDLPWHHNRFGRFYDAAALEKRVMVPARQCGFEVVIYHVLNPTDVANQVNLHFALLLQKPREQVGNGSEQGK